MPEKVDGLEIHNRIIEFLPFDRWAEKATGAHQTLGNIHVTLVFKKNEADAYGDIKGYYDSLPQGWEGSAELVFRVDQPGVPDRYFKKIGTVDSYTEVEWNGKFEEVQAKEKTVTVYEYE